MNFKVLSQSRRHITVYVSAYGLREFAKQWPCFGEVPNSRKLFAEFDPSGELVDISGDDGLDGAGVSAMLDDCLAAIMRRNPEYGSAGQRARLLGDV